MFWKRSESVPLIKPEELARAMSEEAPEEVPMVIVDVRSPKRFRERHLPGAINIPLSELEQRAGDLDLRARTVFY